MTGAGDLAAAKAAARRAALDLRKKARASKPDAPQSAAAQFLKNAQALCYQDEAVVSGYRPIRTELDPTPLLDALAQNGAALCLPVVVGPEQPLVFREWRPGAPLDKGAFGAEIPVDGGLLVEPMVLITPLLAFDRRGFRLGYGGGFYDRTLARLRNQRRTMAIGFAFAEQEIDVIPHGSTDQPLDAIVTDAEVIIAGALAMSTPGQAGGSRAEGGRAEGSRARE